MKRTTTIMSVLFAAAAFGGVAYAQEAPVDDENDQTQDGKAVTVDETATAAPNDGDLPPPQSDDDPAPEVASPGVPPGGLVRQAGIGGRIGYGRAGVLELGGAAGFTAASDITQVNVAPSIGWFAADNLQLSGMVDLAYAKAGDADGTIVTALVEPSYHLPFNRSTFGFLGMGVGASYISGPGAAFAIAPRLGANLMVGRSGILTPSLSWQYNTHDSMDTGEGAVLVVSSAVRANVGYTVMW